MAKLEVLEEFLDEALVLPIRCLDGEIREYTIAPCDGERWLRIRTLQQVARENMLGVTSAEGDRLVVQAMSQRSILADTLGADVAEAMLADGVPPRMIEKAAQTATVFHTDGMDAAKAVWSGKAQSPKTRKGKSGGAATKTRKQGSGSGTSTRKK